jgi:arabinoxylan arabinofuranohydrolase
MKSRIKTVCIALPAILVIFGGCSADAGKSIMNAKEFLLEDQPSREEMAALFAGNLPANLSNSWKIWGHRNPLFTQSFSADPTTMVYNDRVYLFSSNDTLQYNEDGTVKNNGNNYGTGIQGLRVSSSADLANWTDHGQINVTGPANTNPLIDSAAWDQSRLINDPGIDASWAPSATWKMINGKPQFFVYWCNSGNGIGVITADSPTGPWTAPLEKLLIDRNTPNCADVIWLFDPGVFMDDDGQAYLYFGGGTQGLSDMNNTGQARRVKLGADMLSLAGEPETWNVPYLFEACDMFKHNGVYYLSYCTNWNTGGNSYGLSNSQIAYKMGTNPLGIFSDPKPILTSASTQLASFDSNNHQNIFIFKNEVYIAYHTQKPVEAMGLPRGQHGYRSTSIDKVTVESDGTLKPVTMTRKGVEQAGNLNPYVPNEAETIGIQGGIYTRPESGASNGIVVTSIDTGDWLAVYGVDFGATGAKKFAVRVRTPDTPADYAGAIELRLDPLGDGITADNGNLDETNAARIKDGKVIGRVQIKAKSGEQGKYAVTTIDLDEAVTGVHDLVFVFYSSLGVSPETVIPDSRHKNGFEFDQWQFFK